MELGDLDTAPTWAGECIDLISEIEPAGAIVARVVAERPRRAGPGRGGDGRGSWRRAVPRASLPAPRRCSGLCGTVPQRPRYALDALAARLCAGSAPPSASARPSLRRFATHHPRGISLPRFAL